MDKQKGANADVGLFEIRDREVEMARPMPRLPPVTKIALRGCNVEVGNDTAVSLSLGMDD